MSLTQLLEKKTKIPISFSLSKCTQNSEPWTLFTGLPFISRCFQEIDEREQNVSDVPGLGLHPYFYIPIGFKLDISRPKGTDDRRYVAVVCRKGQKTVMGYPESDLKYSFDSLMQ